MKAVYFILWLLCGLGFWYASKDCNCCAAEEVKAVVAPVKKLEPLARLSPVGFECSDSKPKLAAKWANYKDSLINSLRDDQILEIRGYDLPDEVNNSGSQSLGLARASAVRQLFSVNDDRVRVVRSPRRNECREDAMYNLVTFKALMNSAKIKEVDDRTLIYFPFNSTNKLADADVETYLDDVVTRVNKSGERIAISGHTDNVGGDSAGNMELGQKRADMIKSYLVSKGLDASRIEATSQGPKSPIADNNTDEGRAQNRRAELQIIK